MAKNYMPLHQGNAGFLKDLYPQFINPDVERGSSDDFDYEAALAHHSMESYKDPSMKLSRRALNKAVNKPKWANKKFGDNENVMSLIGDVRGDWDPESGKKFRLDYDSLEDLKTLQEFNDLNWKNNFQESHGSLNKAADQARLDKFYQPKGKKQEKRQAAEAEAPEPVANTGNVTSTPMPSFSETWAKSKQKSQDWIVGADQWKENIQNYKDQSQSTSEKAGTNFLNDYMSQNQLNMNNSSARADARSGKIKAMGNAATAATALIT